MLRSYLFSIIFFSGIIIISIIFLPALLLPKKIVLFGGKTMGYWAGFCIKIILNTEIEVRGKENIIKDKKFFIAASHQYMFETFYLQTIFNSPIFILKKELLKIPIFGWYLKKIGSVSVQRNQVTKENLSFFDDIKAVIEYSKRPLVIFPQGTRVKTFERPHFKKGTARIYEKLKISCQPVAINSGNVWPKNEIKKANKKITLSILPAINYGLDKKKFLENLENLIYSELDKIN